MNFKQYYLLNKDLYVVDRRKKKLRDDSYILPNNTKIVLDHENNSKE